MRFNLQSGAYFWIASRTGLVTSATMISSTSGLKSMAIATVMRGSIA